MFHKLVKTMTDLGIPSPETKAQTMVSYMDEILKWNEKVNLTAITDRDGFIAKHLLDSLSCASTDEFKEANTIIDVGTGGGFPGVPLAVAFPEKKFLLLDSLRKRMNIVEEICESLGITGVETIHGRAEDLARRDHLRDSFDLCVSRAVAAMPVLCELCLPFVREGGSFIAFKGADWEREVSEAQKAMKLLSSKLVRTIPQTREKGMESHCLVVIKKEGSTDSSYPRRAGIPVRKPLK